MPIKLSSVLDQEDRFDSILKETAKYEGGYVEDHAGPTNFGVTQRTYDSYRKKQGLQSQSVKRISKDEVRNIAQDEYFVKPKFDQLPDSVAEVMFDFGFHSGPARATKEFQKVIGSTPDGKIGPKTLKAANDYIAKNGEKSLIKNVVDRRKTFLEELIKNNPSKYKKYENGWMNRINAIKEKFDLSFNPFALGDGTAHAGEVLRLSDVIGDSKPVRLSDIEKKSEPISLEQAMRVPEDPRDNLTFFQKVLTSKPMEILDKGSEFFGNVKKSFNRGAISAELDQASYLALEGKLDFDKEVRPLIEKQREVVKADPVEGKNIITKALYSVSEMLPAMMSGIVEGMGIGALAATGAAALGQAGPQALTPEEIVTVPTAYTVGQTMGSFEYWRRQGAGSLYAELKMKEIDDSLAQPVSHIGGALYGAVEFSQVDKLIPGSKEATKGIIGNTLMKTFQRMAVKYGANWAQEVGEEGIQEIIMATSEEVSAKVAGKSDKNNAKILNDVMIRGWEASKQSAIPMLFLLGPSAGVDIKNAADELGIQSEVRKEMARRVINEVREEENTIEVKNSPDAKPLTEKDIGPIIRDENGDIIPVELKPGKMAEEVQKAENNKINDEDKALKAEDVNENEIINLKGKYIDGRKILKDSYQYKTEKIEIVINETFDGDWQVTISKRQQDGSFVIQNHLTESFDSKEDALNYGKKLVNKNKPVNPEEKALIEEAKKYKTVDEFVKAQNKIRKEAELKFITENAELPEFQKEFKTIRKTGLKTDIEKLIRTFKGKNVKLVLVSKNLEGIEKWGIEETKTVTDIEKFTAAKQNVLGEQLSKQQLTTIWNKAHKQIETSKDKELIEEAKKYDNVADFISAKFGEAPDYGMSHRPTYDLMPPAYDLLEGDQIPKDVYEHPEWSVATNGLKDLSTKQSWEVVKKLRGNPEADVTVYRATRKKELSVGDWITFSKNYAQDSIDPNSPEKVYSFKIKAKDAIFAGDDINEFGYYPDSRKQQLTTIWNKAQGEVKGVEQDFIKEPDQGLSYSPMEKPKDILSSDPDAPADVRPYQTHSMPMRIERPAGEVKGVSAPDVIDSLQNAIYEFGGNTPIRFGKVKSKKAAGWFNPKTEVIRVKTANNIITATHEVGHYLEKLILPELMKESKSKGRKAIVKTTRTIPLELFPNKSHAELSRLGYELYGPKEPHNGYVSEGIAEFTRLWVTDRDMAKRMAPDFYDWFEKDFLPNYEKGANLLDVARDQSVRWQQQGAVGRAKESIVNPDKLKEKIRAAKEWVSNSKTKLIRQHIEMLEPLRLFSQEAEQRGGKDLAPDENPYITASALRTTQDARTKYMVDNGMIDLAGNIVGPALKDIMPLVKSKRNDFTIYLWAKRSLSLWNDPKKPEGRNPGMSKEDAQQIISELDSPQFQLAAQKVYDWNDGVLNYAAQASPTFARIVDKIRKVDPGNYIPLSREFRDLDNMWARGGVQRSARGGKLSGKLKGSGRRIKDPFPQMISNARSTIKAAHNRLILDQVIKLSKIKGMGYLIEKVPKDMVPSAKANLVDVIKQAGKDLAEYGISLKAEGMEDLDEISALQLLGETMTFYAPSKFPGGKDPIFPVWNNDKVEWYQLDGELYKALESMEVYRLPDVAGIPILDWIFGKPTRLFRAGTTGLRASFSLVANPIRDMQTLYMNTQSEKNGMHMMSAWMQSMSDAALKNLTGKANPYYDAFLRLGGEMAQPLGQDIPHTRRAAKTLFEGRVIRTLDPRNWYDSVRDILQFPESAPRVAELRLLSKKIDWDPSKPMTLNQSLQLLLASKQVTTDFTAMGEFARVFNQMVPFYNAAIQGPRANARAAGRNPMRFVWRGLQISAVTLALWWRYKDEDWYKEMDAREKFMYWHFPATINGEETLIRIPRAFEIGQVFASMPEAFMDSWYRQDPESANEWFNTFSEIAMPNMAPVIIEESAEQLANKDFFFDSPIVSQGLERKPPEEQYNEFSSRLSIFLGDLFKVSPKRIDHAITGVGGYVAGDIVDMLGLGPAVQEKEKELADIPVGGRLFMRGGPYGYRQKSVDEMYDLLEKARLKQYSDKHEETEDERQGRLMLEDASKAVSRLSYIKSRTPEMMKRRKITDEALSIAKDAIQLYKEGKTNRGKFRQIRKDAEKRKQDFQKKD